MRNTTVAEIACVVFVPVELFYAPNAALKPQGGTVAVGINLGGAVAGYFMDASGAIHGFIRTPQTGH